MNILQINTADQGGGAEGSARGLFQRYRELGHNSWLAVGRKHSQDQNIQEIPRPAVKNPLRRICQLAAVATRAAEGNLPGARRLSRCLERLASAERWLDWLAGREEMDFPGCQQLLSLWPAPPDIIHCHNLHGWYFDLRVLPELSQQAPLILNLRDTWTMTGHCAYFMDCERWKTGCGQCPRLQVYPACRKDATADNWRRKADIYARSRLHITAPSQWLLDQARQSMLTAASYRCIPNGINTAIFQPGDRQEARQKLDLPSGVDIVMFAAAARHSVFKDPETLEAALLQFAARRPDALLLGVGMKKPGRSLRNVNLRCIPYVSDPARLAAYYQAADVFIHTAKAEAFGKTITEAMACGTPTVASEVGGIPEQVINGKTGWLCKPENPTEMADKIAQLLAENHDAKQTWRQNAAEQGKKFSLERQTAAFLDWYQELVAEQRRV